MHRNQNVVRADTTGGQRAIVLRPHDRKGLPTCQAVSLHATREPGRSPGSDNGHYVPHGVVASVPDGHKACAVRTQEDGAVALAAPASFR